MKRFLILLNLLLLALSVGAQAVFEPVVLTIDSPTGLYSAGEQVTVYGHLSTECSTPLDLSVMVNGTTTEYADNIALSTQSPTPIWSGSFDKASSVILSVGPKGEKKERTTIGFVVAAEEFTPSFATPHDLRQFWNKQMRRMRRSKAEVKLTEVEIEEKWRADYICYDIEISMPEGAPVRGYMALPLSATGKTLPIVIFAHAAGVRKTHCQSTPERALQWASKGGRTIAFDINAHGYLNGQPQSYYDDLESGALKDYSKWPLTDHQSFYFRTMFLRLVRTLDYATKSPLWDGTGRSASSRTCGHRQEGNNGCDECACNDRPRRYGCGPQCRLALHILSWCRQPSNRLALWQTAPLLRCGPTDWTFHRQIGCGGGPH